MSGSSFYFRSLDTSSTTYLSNMEYKKSVLTLCLGPFVCLTGLHSFGKCEHIIHAGVPMSKLSLKEHINYLGEDNHSDSKSVSLPFTVW